MGEAEIEVAKANVDSEVSRRSTTYLWRNTLVATDVAGVDDDDNEVEDEMKLAASKAEVGINNTLAQFLLPLRGVRLQYCRVQS